MIINIDRMFDGVWMFQVRRGQSVESVGTADDYETCLSMALEARADVAEFYGLADPVV